MGIQKKISGAPDNLDTYCFAQTLYMRVDTPVKCTVNAY